jgi:2-desacetyl-2-hydroxyethyl bacteriochlorophyllide A dehydrogenase
MSVALATATMRAAVVAGPRSLRLERVPRPEPGPGQILLRVEGCGLCGSNLPVWDGTARTPYPLAPGAPGHEAWGHVDAVGDGVDESLLGLRVGALTYRSFAEWDVAAAEEVVPLPPELDGRLFPGEALACAVNVFRRSGVRSGDDVAVVGIGFLGALLVQLAAATGARVTAYSRRPFALAVAMRCGAHEALPLEAARDESCDVAIEAAGVQETLDTATRLVRVRGRLVIAGYHQDGTRRVDLQLWNWRGFDVVNAHERDPRLYVDGLRRAARAVADGTLDPDHLYTHVFSLEQLAEAADRALSRPDGFLKAVILP